MNVEFQGFQNILPPFLTALIIIGLAVLAWYSYRNKKSIPPLPRWGLITTRAIALILLFLLLMNPFFYSSELVERKPRIAVFLDNSESAGIEKGNYRGNESYDELLNTLSFESRDTFDFDFYSIGVESSPISPDSLRLDEPQTNLSVASDKILELEEGIKAAVMITDGIITFGRDPSFAISTSSFPVYTIGLGDTTEVRDVSVSNIVTNQTGYTNTRQRIQAEITQSGYEGRTVVVSLLEGNDVRDQQEIEFNTSNQVIQAEFNLLLEEAGLKPLTIRVSPLEDEWTEANNQKSFSVNVLDSRVKILHVAWQIHPDVKMLRSILAEDINNELTPLTWLGNGNFVEDIPDAEEYNLVVFHGAPPSASAINQLPVSGTLTEVPFLFLSLDASFASTNRVPILIQPQSRRTVQVTLNQMLEADEQPILELPAYVSDNLPLLFAPIQTQNIDPQSTELFTLTFDGIDTESPLISILERGNVRRAQVAAWGWYRLSQSQQDNHRQLVRDLFSNLAGWTSSDPDNRNLQISPARQSFNTNERPVINATLQNESGVTESDAIIEVQVRSEDSEGRSFNMQSEGDGNYRLQLPNLSEGLYEYQAIARKGNREIDQREGEFLVSNASTELSNVNRNDDLLRGIAANTDGSYFTFDEVSAFWDTLQADNVFEAQTETVENYRFPVRNWYWFALVLLLLGSEWLIRKFYSLP